LYNDEQPPKEPKSNQTSAPPSRSLIMDSSLSYPCSLHTFMSGVTS
jgi:hypothetical protein